MPNDQRTIVDYIMESKIPISLLFFLVLQFLMIMIDRVLYLRKEMMGKVYFQLLTAFFFHFWIFLVLPTFTGKTLNETTLPLLFYFINCVYLLIAAYQIRSGYPPRVLGNFIMKHFTAFRMIAFKV